MKGTGFPKDFLWGAALSNVQAEGAYLADGKGLTVYDTLEIRKEKGQTSVRDTSVASNHYYQYREDIRLMKEMGFRAYRFSVVWSRINPTGTETTPNKAGLDYYEEMVDELRRAGIEPVVSLVHFDMPDHLAKEYNGFYSSHVVKYYAMHVRQVVERLKDKVKYWITYNEINTALFSSQLVAGATRPEQVSKGEFYATLIHHLQLAHAEAVHIIKELSPTAKVSGMVNYACVDPKTTRPRDVEAAHIANNYLNFLPLDIMVRGEYPAYYRAFLRNRKIREDREGMDRIREASKKMDFIALSYYQTSVICGTEQTDSSAVEDGIIFGIHGKLESSEYLTTTKWGWTINPDGLKQALEILHQRYHKPLFVVENGMALTEEPDQNGELHDEVRIAFYRDHIRKMHEAMECEGVEVMGYLAWSPIDFLSSHKEMEKRYGFVYVGSRMENGRLSRIPKKSFYWYKKVIESDGEDLE
ncbi:MAG: glycoside hydrolase family 1 protein [Lachnospiraceae bacterium]|jgi:6-phospho-beta-glucosidase|nr:glycoside hydrolase family 1 protein [Lachnospiraceae bacterium]